LARNTIRKWVREPEAKQPVYQRRAVFNKLSAFHATLEQALKADSLRPKQQRRSAKVLWAHYLFDPDFGNVASGWEKGIVEKNVQDSRRRIWLDAQDCQFHSFEELNAWLGQRYRALWNDLPHPHYGGLSVA
jgi:hypothetical protein